TKGLVFAIVDTERIGMGRPVPTVYVGLSTEDAEGGGIKVTLVAEDGPAGKAGFKDGDIITQIDDKKIANYDEFNAFLFTKKPGDTIKVTLKRDGKEEVIEVKLAPREPAEAAAPQPKGKGGQRGGGGAGGAATDPNQPEPKGKG